MRIWLAVSIVGVVCGTALAENGDRQQLGDGYSLLVENWGIHVVKGKSRAKVAPGFAILDAKVDKKAKKVSVEIDNNDCAGTDKYTWTFAHLDARMENTAAFALHKKKDYKGSAVGFAKAVAADPAWDIAAYNLASAQQLLGDKPAAVKTLAPWIASAPLQTLLHVATDPELSPLLDQPELEALRTSKAGTATISGEGDVVGVAYAKERGLIAVTRHEGSWGACSFTDELELRDAKTGAIVAHVATVQWNESDMDCGDSGGGGILKNKRPAVAARAKLLTQILRELGFVTAKLEKGSQKTHADSGAEVIRFSKSKLGVAANNGTARLLMKDKELGQTTVLEHIDRAVLLDDPKIAVVWSLRAGREGCEGTDPTDVSIIPFAKP